MVERKIAKLKRVKRPNPIHLVVGSGETMHGVVNDIIWKTIRPSLDDLYEVGVLSAQKRKVIQMMLRQSMEDWIEQRGNDDGTAN